MFLPPPVWGCRLPDVTFPGIFAFYFIDGDCSRGGFSFNLRPFLCDDFVYLPCPDLGALAKSRAFVIVGDNIFTESMQRPDFRFLKGFRFLGLQVAENSGLHLFNGFPIKGNSEDV